jgi:hypothetical protein
MQSEADPLLVINVPIGKGWRRSKVGYINGHGVQVIPPRFDDGLKFSDGLAAAKLGKKWGFIDRRIRYPSGVSNIFTFSRGSRQNERAQAAGTLEPSSGTDIFKLRQSLS